MLLALECAIMKSWEKFGDDGQTERVKRMQDEVELENIYWKGQWLEKFLQEFWSAVPRPAVISPGLRSSAKRLLSAEAQAGTADQLEEALRYSAYWLPQWRTEVQLELLSGSWTLAENGTRPAPVEVIYLGKLLRMLSACVEEKGHYPEIYLTTEPAELRRAAWASWLEEVRQLPPPVRRSGHELLTYLLNAGGQVHPAALVDESLREKALGYLDSRRAEDGGQSGLEFVTVKVPPYDLTVLLELESGYFTAQFTSEASDRSRQMLNDLVCFRGYTAEEAANDEGILCDYAAARRDMLWKDV